MTESCGYVATITASKVSKYGVFSRPFFPALRLNTGKYESEKTPHLDTFHAVFVVLNLSPTCNTVTYSWTLPQQSFPPNQITTSHCR